jgi:hypothetical protein
VARWRRVGVLLAADLVLVVLERAGRWVLASPSSTRL